MDRRRRARGDAPIGAGLLEGITRGWLIEALGRAGIPVGEEAIDERRLRAAGEVFLSGTIKGIMPVTRIDGEAVGVGGPGGV
ncbi:MAG: hypothetical protein HC813_01950, partial [Planctomycetes bacterium]|nr:hypothetical protein [Planctomycetota bacterium]